MHVDFLVSVWKYLHTFRHPNILCIIFTFLILCDDCEANMFHIRPRTDDDRQRFIQMFPKYFRVKANNKNKTKISK